MQLQETKQGKMYLHIKGSVYIILGSCKGHLFLYNLEKNLSRVFSSLVWFSETITELIFHNDREKKSHCYLCFFFFFPNLL